MSPEREALFWRRAFTALCFSMVWRDWWMQVINFGLTMVIWQLWDGFDPDKECGKQP